MHAAADEILVADDDEENRAALDALLTDAGYRVRQAADGAACLEAVAAAAPALILLDVSMPGLDGLETLRRLRVGPHRDVPVILLTGKRLDPESIGSGLELGAEEYLRKPVRPDELKARVRALLHLHAARRELEALKRDQSAMLVHDLRQPLAVIALRAEFIADEAKDPEMARSGQVIHDACAQMSRLIDSVLELSRVEAGQMRLERAPADLPALVAGVAEQLRGLAERRGIALTVHATGAAAELPIDRNKIVQVLQNLLGNALKFTPTGGRIGLGTVRNDAQIEVYVEDTGPGLPAGEAEQVFDKWHQTGIGRAQGGSGLGLAIARAIVEAHGGKVHAGARLDGERGARFSFTLPLAHGETAAAPSIALSASR